MRLSLFLIAIYGLFNSSYVVSEHRSLNFKELMITRSNNVQFYTPFTVDLESSVAYHLNLGQYYTALKISIADTADVLLITGSDTQMLTQNCDSLFVHSKFIVFKQPMQTLTIQAKANTQLNLEAFYAPAINFKVAAKSETRKHTPDIISPAIWRAGLPSPIEGRSTTNVQTCVIHHSATSNTDTNYVNVLRNVYLLHTQSNGWDDIGYNFLIAGDGTVFRGRDVEANNENEHVVGAHFCGNNHHTSGICLLGNFNTASLSKNAEDALVRLLTWEHEDFDLEPSKSIVPHSSGCPTACPGEKLNTHLPIIQSKVAQQLEMKDNPMVEEFKNEVWSKVYPNPSTGRFFIMANKTLNNARAIIYNETKQVVHQQQLTKQGLVKASIPSGLYFLEVLLESGEVINTRIVIY